MEDGTFDALERDFQETLDELMGDQSLEKFRTEYEKLHRALKKSHDNERRLMQKCRELNVEIVANAAKVSSALKLSQEDKATINSLKQVRWMFPMCDGLLWEDGEHAFTCSSWLSLLCCTCGLLCYKLCIG